jgi:hypothetical protein
MATPLQRLGEIRRAAISCRCTGIRQFTQVLGAVQEALTEKGAGGGICRSLSVQWLAARKSHADFFGRLLGVGGSVHKGALGEVIEAFKAMPKLNRIAQRQHVEDELRKAGLTPVGATEVKNAPDFRGVSCAGWFCNTLESGPLRFLGIRGGVDHATALDLTAGREAFFDPNLGEFQFTGNPQYLLTFLLTQIFPPGGDASCIGRYVSSPNLTFSQVEKVRCS